MKRFALVSNPLVLVLTLSCLLVAWLPGSQAAPLRQAPPPRRAFDQPDGLPFLQTERVKPEAPDEASPLGELRCALVGTSG